MSDFNGLNQGYTPIVADLPSEGNTPQLNSNNNVGNGQSFGDRVLAEDGKGFRYFDKGECPVCRERADCRQSLSTGLIHCRGESQSFTLLGLDSIGFGIWSDGVDEIPTNFKSKEKAGTGFKPEGKGESPLSASQRSEIIEKLSGLGLSAAHKESLKKRGLTLEQIAKGNFFSVKAWQGVDIDERFPGTKEGGKSLLVGGSGIAIPVPDVDGNFIGLQVRYDNPDKGGKYKWVSSSKGYSGHIGREMPIGVYKPDVESSDRVGLIEGFLKPAIACQRWGHTMIGAAGANFGEKQLKRTLDKLFEGRGDKTVYFYPDAGCKSNKDVVRSYAKTRKTVEALGYELKFIWWGQETKDAGDADEVEVDGLQYEALSAGWFLNEMPTTEIDYLKSLKHGQTTVNQKYLDITYPREGLFYVKSLMGTGKTYSLRKEIPGIEARGERALLLGYRNSLLQQTSTTLGFRHIADIASEETNKSRAASCEQFLALCVDSMSRLNPAEWKGCTLIIDEVESVIAHLLSGSTCKRQRAKLFSIWTQLIRGAKRVIIADAHLTNVSVDYLESLRQEKATGVVNLYKTKEQRQVYYYWNEEGGSLEQGMLDEVVSKIERGERVIVATDAQIVGETIHRMLLERGFKNGLRIDSTTKNEDRINELLDKPNEVLVRLKLAYLIYSPTIESGVSIDVDCFDAVYFVGRGVVAPGTVLQMLGRVRSNIPWHICIPKVGIPDAENPHTTAEEVLAQWRFNTLADFGLVPMEDFRQWYMENVSFFPQPSPGECRKYKGDRREYLADQVKKFQGLISDVNTAHHIAQAQLKARDNYERNDYREEVLSYMTGLGYQPVQGFGTRLEGAGKSRAEIKEEIKEEKAQRIVEAQVLEVIEAEKILKNDRSTENQRNSAIKTILLDRYPGINLTVEMVRRCWVDSKGAWLKGVENDWLRKHQDVINARTVQAWGKRLASGSLWHSDVSTKHLRLNALERLNIDVFLDPERQFTYESTEVQEFKRRFLANKRLQTLFGVSVSQKTPAIGLINDVLRKTLATGLNKVREEDKKPVFQIEPDYRNDPMRLEILHILDCKKLASKSAETVDT